MRDLLQNHLTIPPDLALACKSTQASLSPEQIRMVILDAFISIDQKKPNVIPLQRLLNRGPFYLSVTRSVEKGKERVYLTPSLNGMGITHIKVEFTCLVEANYKIS